MSKAESTNSDENKVVDRTLLNWLIKDDKTLTSGLALDVYKLAEQLHREPLSVLRRLMDDRVIPVLTKKGLNFEFEPGSEEEAEFFGLALCGVPLNEALCWCMGLEARASGEKLNAMMTSPDFRPATHLARELGIWFTHTHEMADMRFLQEMPTEITQAAIEDILERFDAPTPDQIMRQIEGIEPEPERPYVWAIRNQPNPTSTNLPRAKAWIAKKTKAKTKYRKSSAAWKPFKRKSNWHSKAARP